MKAILSEGYGPPERVLHLRDVEKPLPRESEVLLKVHAASVNIANYYMMTGVSHIMGGGIIRSKDPRVGSDVAGRVEAVGESVTRFRTGDEVFGTCLGAFA